MAERQNPEQNFPFTRKNWRLFAVGLGLIVFGYLLLSIPPADGFLSLTLAPILLVVGYCVVIPAAILVKDHSVSAGDQPAR